MGLPTQRALLQMQTPPPPPGIVCPALEPGEGGLSSLGEEAGSLCSCPSHAHRGYGGREIFMSSWQGEKGLLAGGCCSAWTL